MNAFRNHILLVALLETIRFLLISFTIIRWPIIISFGTFEAEELWANVENKKWSARKQTFHSLASTPRPGMKSIRSTDKANAFLSNLRNHTSLDFRKLLRKIWDKWLCLEVNVWLLEVLGKFTSLNRLSMSWQKLNYGSCFTQSRKEALSII